MEELSVSALIKKAKETHQALQENYEQRVLFEDNDEAITNNFLEVFVKSFDVNYKLTKSE